MNVKLGFPDKRRFYFTKLVEQDLSAEITSNGCKMEACKRLWTWNDEQNKGISRDFNRDFNGVFYIFKDATLSNFKINFKILTNSDLFDNIPKTNDAQGIFLPIDTFNKSPAILDILAIVIRLLDLPELFDSRDELIRVVGPRIIYKNGDATRYYTEEVARAIENFDKFISKIKEDKRLDDVYADSIYGNFGLIYFLTIPKIRAIFLDESN